MDDVTLRPANGIIPMYKPAGWTPLQAIERLKALRPELRGQKVACAGRLDPMAEGVLVVLAGEQLKQFDQFCSLDKEYEAEILLGITSDTGDVMGMTESRKVHQVHKACPVVPPQADTTGVIKSLAVEIDNLKGDLRLPVPVYSSWRVQGKPLYWWARQGRLHEIEIPLHEISIFRTQWLGASDIEAVEVRHSVMERLHAVHGDFRQETIHEQWKHVLDHAHAPFLTFSFYIHCSSGTYVRSVVQELGKRLGTKMLLYRLVRTRVGEYHAQNAFYFI